MQSLADRNFQEEKSSIKPPRKFRELFQAAVRKQQIYLLERIWYSVGNDQSPFANDLMRIMQRLGEKYEIDELASKYPFVGQTPMTVPEAIAIKEELEKIDELLKQLEQARETAQIALVDFDALSEFAEPGEMENLESLQQQIQDYIREMAERQGLQNRDGAFQLTPQAYRMFQGKLLERIFDSLQESKSGRHQADIDGDGAVELQQN